MHRRDISIDRLNAQEETTLLVLESAEGAGKIDEHMHPVVFLGVKSLIQSWKSFIKSKTNISHTLQS